MAKSRYKQSAVIPYRILGGSLEVLLITTRSGKKWVIPKGLIEEKLSPLESARKEAIEEAGIEGAIPDITLGYYEYEKWAGVCRVQVFAMRVETLHDLWLEDFRVRRWYPISEAIRLAAPKQLAKIIEDFAGIFEGNKEHWSNEF